MIESWVMLHHMGPACLTAVSCLHLPACPLPHQVVADGCRDDHAILGIHQHRAFLHRAGEGRTSQGSAGQGIAVHRTQVGGRPEQGMAGGTGRVGAGQGVAGHDAQAGQ